MKLTTVFAALSIVNAQTDSSTAKKDDAPVDLPKLGRGEKCDKKTAA